MLNLPEGNPGSDRPWAIRWKGKMRKDYQNFFRSAPAGELIALGDLEILWCGCSALVFS